MACGSGRGSQGRGIVAIAGSNRLGKKWVSDRSDHSQQYLNFRSSDDSSIQYETPSVSETVSGDCDSIGLLVGKPTPFGEI